jgi:Mg-chelatase subunit ChlD
MMTPSNRTSHTRTWKTKALAAALIGMTVTAVALYPTVKTSATTAGQQHIAQSPQRIEVVFVLDTTSSMSGLIDTAKEKIWSIATTMAQAEQAPEIHMGLVAFRDRGDDYVTRVVDLSTDIDSMYATLMQFQAAGGGDGPESVNAALADAVGNISWSQDSSSYRVIFLVGDAPPHMDYFGETRYPAIVREAADRGIVVNTIQCGDVQQTVAAWTEIASLGNGRYMKVGQAGDAFAVTTPFDEALAQLSAQLDETRLFYGSEAELEALDAKASATQSLHELASFAARARRAVFNSTASGVANLFGGNDLVDDIASGEIELDAVPTEQLPAALQALDRDAQAAELAAIASRRSDLQQKIERLASERAGYIEERVNEAEGADSSLDRQIFDVVREQAAPLGLTYEGGPEF